MDRETAAFYDSIVKSLDRIVGCVGGLSFDEVNSRRPGPTSNGLYAIATHALANAERNVLSTYCGEAYTWNRAAEFAARGESSGALEANWRLLRERMRVALEAAGPEALLEERDHPHMGRVAGRAVLLRAAVHAAEHAGEADLTRALVVNAAPRSITSADSGSAFVVGVDGCRAGWAAAVIDLARTTLDVRVFPTFESVLQEFGGARCITVDIPIGLTDGPRRECDILARVITYLTHQPPSSRILGQEDTAMSSEPQTLIDAIRYFSDPDVCHSLMVLKRWPDGVVTCPTCGRTDVRYIATRRLFQCKDRHPRSQFSVKVGTIFEDSPMGLDKWFAAIWMIANDKNGVSSYEMARALGITQKSAWFMLHRIRYAMQSGDFRQMGGQVEVDETFIGGKSRFMHKDKRATKITGTGGAGKAAVMGLLERHGPDGHSVVRAKVVNSRRAHALTPEVRRNVVPGAEVFSDALGSYSNLKADYVHQVIDHAESYVDGQIHTNGIENFWSLLKRALKGTYVSVEPFHWFRYLDEETFRFNTRHETDGDRFQRLGSKVAGKRLTYAQLTGAVGTTQ